MNLARYLKLIRKPDIILGYVKKYSAQKARLAKYTVCKKLKYDIHKNYVEKVRKYIKHGHAGGFAATIKDSAPNLFLSEDFNKVISNISQNSLYTERIIRQADLVLGNSFYILYKQIDNMYDSTRECYKWDVDYVTGYKYNQVHYTIVRQKNASIGTDIKRVWEIARMQYLFAPALAYRITKDEKYALKVKDVISDFIRNNLMDEGINWNLSMETGIRLANILLAFELILPSSCVDGKFIEEIIASAIEHRDHILRNEENINGKTSNHYLGGLLGLAACSVFFKDYPGNRKIFEYVSYSINKEINKQILDDGGDYEGSTSYQRLVGELIGFTVLLCEKSGAKIQLSSYERLRKMFRFTVDITAPDETVPQIGDNDCGRVFQLLPEKNTDHSFYVNLISWITNRQIVYPNIKNGIECFIGKYDETAVPAIQYPEFIVKDNFKIAVLRYNSVYLLISANESQNYGMGGHTHNDMLSFVLYIGTHPVILDPGSGTYTSDPVLRNILRNTGSHSTVKIHGEEQRISNKAELFGWRSKCSSDIRFTENDAKLIIECFHDGYVLRTGCHHKRIFEISKTSDLIKITDSIMCDMHSNDDNIVPHEFFIQLYGTDTLCKINTREYSLSVGTRKIQISSSSDMDMTDGVYSHSYDSVTSIKILHGLFISDQNIFTIGWE